MSIIHPDIDQIIIPLLDVYSLANINSINKYYYEFTIKIPLLAQYQDISKNTSGDAYSKLLAACYLGYLECVQYFINHYKFDTYYILKDLFYRCCVYGQIIIAKYLISLENLCKLDIHMNNNIFIRFCIAKNHYEMAKWLVSFGTYRRYMFPNNKAHYHRIDDDEYMVQWFEEHAPGILDNQ